MAGELGVSLDYGADILCIPGQKLLMMPMYKEDMRIIWPHKVLCAQTVQSILDALCSDLLQPTLTSFKCAEVSAIVEKKLGALRLVQGCGTLVLPKLTLLPHLLFLLGTV